MTAALPATAPGRRGAPRALWLVLLLATALVAALLPTLYRVRFAERVLPGVRVAGVHVGGLTRDAARLRLAAAGNDPSEPVTIRTEGLEPTALEAAAIALDLDATLDAAFAVGRSGSRARQLGLLVRSRAVGVDLPAIVRLDASALEAALAEVAAAYDVAPVDARLVLEPRGVTATEARVGRSLDVAAASARLAQLAAAGAWPLASVEVPAKEVAPAVTDVTPALEQARTLASGPVELTQDAQRWTLTPEQLVGAMSVVTAGSGVRLALEPDRWSALLAPVTEAVSRTAEPPRFRFDPATGRLAVTTPALDGLQVDVEATADAILRLDAGQARTVPVAVVRTAPPITNTVSAEELGIRELVAESTSYYVGSAPGRVTNVRIAASKFDGVVIPPDGVFSFNHYLGDVSAEAGYQKTLIILDGATADGIGGGVCQVSTTMFRAAFWAGLPIVERWAHGYRVGYYEQHSGPGMDATVYSPVVDLKVKNDTGHALLIEAVPNTRAMTLTFRLYGTKPDREVAMEGPFTTNVVPPPPARVEVDPSLPPGASESKELARNGASVTVRRIIRAPGAEDKVETFHSRYVPTGALTLVGPPAAPPASPDNAQAAAGAGAGADFRP